MASTKPSARATITAIVVLVVATAIGLLLQTRSMRTTVESEQFDQRGVTIEQITTTDAEVPPWWVLVPAGGIVVAAGILVTPRPTDSG